MAEAVLKELGNRVRARRKELGLAQEQLSLVAGIDRSYMGRIERGEQNLSFTVLCKVCIALECDVAAITQGIPKR